MIRPGKRAGLNELMGQYAAELRLTPSHNLVVAGMAAEHSEDIAQILQAAELDGTSRLSALRKHSMACVAMPTCGLAMAEAERYPPDLITRIEGLADKHDIGDQPINIRMSGCPKGCSRPYLGEIVLVGRAPGCYNLYLGASFNGDRLNKLVLDNADGSSSRSIH